MYSISFAIYGGAVATRLWLREHVSDRGATAVEYGLLVGLIAVVIAVAVSLLGGGLSHIFGSTATCINNAGGNTPASTASTVASACPGV